MLKNFVIVLFLVYILHFNGNICGPVSQNMKQDTKQDMRQNMSQDMKPSDRQLEFPDNNIPVNPPRYPRREPRTEGLISRVINFFRDLIGGRRRSNDGGKGVDDEGGYAGGRDVDSDSDGILTFIRKRVSGFIDSLITVFGGSPSQTPEANFPYNKIEPYRNL